MKEIYTHIVTTPNLLNTYFSNFRAVIQHAVATGNTHYSNLAQKIVSVFYILTYILYHTF